MKGPDGHLLGLADPHQFLQPLAHLLRGLVRKGNAEYAPWRDLFVLHKVGHAVSDDASLAAPRSGQNKQRPISCCNSPLLGLV